MAAKSRGNTAKPVTAGGFAYVVEEEMGNWQESGCED
jgi:hypothetical protein